MAFKRMNDLAKFNNKQNKKSTHTAEIGEKLNLVFDN